MRIRVIALATMVAFAAPAAAQVVPDPGQARPDTTRTTTSAPHKVVSKKKTRKSIRPARMRMARAVRPLPPSLKAIRPIEAPLDVNSASAEEFDGLYGIGKPTARAIVSGRPYHSTRELVSKGILPVGVYDKIKGQLAVNRF